MPDRAPVIQVQAQCKRPRHSKTLWFNGLVAGLAAAEAQIGLLQPLLPVDVYQLLVFVLVVGNAVLRVYTAARLVWGQA